MKPSDIKFFAQFFDPILNDMSDPFSTQGGSGRVELFSFQMMLKDPHGYVERSNIVYGRDRIRFRILEEMGIPCTLRVEPSTSSAFVSFSFGYASYMSSHLQRPEPPRYNQQL